MKILHISTGEIFEAIVENVEAEDLKKLKKARFGFNWRLEKLSQIYKLRLVNDDEILGLMSLDHFESEKRIEIRLLEI